MNTFSSRIDKEKKQIKKILNDEIFFLSSVKNDRYCFLLLGPLEYTNYFFQSKLIEIYLPISYPLKPPGVLFISRIFHPNIDPLGRPCIDILKDEWSPALQIRTLILSAQSFMTHPNFNDPLDQKLSKIFQNNKGNGVVKKIVFILNDLTPC